MATNPPPPFCQTVHGDDVPREWLLTMETIGDPLALSRVLEKLSVPAVELLAVLYQRNADTGHLMVRVKGSAAWLQLLRLKLEKLIATQAVALHGPVT